MAAWSPSSAEATVMWFVRSPNVIQPNCRKRLRGFWVDAVRGSAARLQTQAEQSRPVLDVDLIWAPPLLPKSQTYTTFIYSSWSTCYRAAPNTNYIFQPGLDQRKQAGGVIGASLPIRAQQRRDNQSSSRAISLITLLFYSSGGSKRGRFVATRPHGNILLSGLKPS